MLRREKRASFLSRVSIFMMLVMGSAFFCSAEARAELSDRQSFLKIALYGLASGTVLGLVAAPLAKSPRAIFLGSSIGLYLGSVAGIYHVTHRHDPGNPLSSESQEFSLAPGMQASRPLIAVSFPVATF